MSKLFEFITPGKLKELLRQYSEVFKRPIFLLDGTEEVLLKYPEDSSETGLDLRPLNLRDSLLAYVAMKKAKTSQLPLDFIAENLSAILEADYEIDNLSGEVARNYEELSILWRLSSKLGIGLDADQTCHVLADEFMDICPVKNVSVLLLVESGQETAFHLERDNKSSAPVKSSFLIPKVSLGVDASRAATMILSPDRGLIGYAFDKKAPITVCDVSKDERFEGLPYPVNRIFIVPLLLEGKIIGVVVASDKINGEEFYSPQMKLLFSIASECAASIKKAMLYDEIHDILFKTAEAFSLAIDAKDPYTYGHSKRVSQLSVNIAQELGLSRETKDWIRLAALLHDTGKIGVPEDILHKAEKLDADAVEKIKKHPEVGANMIGHITKFREVAKWICHHHEKCDGSGYPLGLKGDEIPLPSKIIAVADVYDALTTDRPYRKALSQDEAMKTMRELADTELDPVVFACLEKLIVVFELSI